MYQYSKRNFSEDETGLYNGFFRVTNDSEALSLLNVLLTRFEKASKRGDDEQADVIESLTATGLGTKGLREKLRDVLESRWSDIAKKASEVVSKCTKRQPSHSSSITSESICRLLEVRVEIAL